jgi:hypothetical protein
MNILKAYGIEETQELRIGLAFEDFLPFLDYLKTMSGLERYKFHGKSNMGLTQMVRCNMDNRLKMFVILGYTSIQGGYN